jgi:hypothetical protein
MALVEGDFWEVWVSNLGNSRVQNPNWRRLATTHF